MRRPWFIAGSLVWMAVVLWLGSRPSLAPAAGLDKAVHFAMFAVFGVLVTSTSDEHAPAPAVVAFAVSAALALSAGDELTQSFVPGRTPDLLDIVADVSGAAAGAVVVLVNRARLRRRADSA